MDIQSALIYAQGSGESDVINIVQGVYIGNLTYYSAEGHSITLLGGFTSGCADRIETPSSTILDGNHSGRVLSVQNISGGDITIDGLTLTNGVASNPGGGGARIQSYSENSTAGNITFNNNTITDNTAYGTYAGGVHVTSQSSSGTTGAIILTNNTILRNTSAYSGGVYARSISNVNISGSITITGNRIAENTATTNYGGGYFESSAGLTGNSSDITFTNNIFSQNTAAGTYGAILAKASSSQGNSGNITFVNNTIANNTANSQSGIKAESASYSGGIPGTVTLTNNTITQNSASSSYGGGVVLETSGESNTINVYNNIIRGNSASTDPDIYISGTGTSNAYNNNYAGTVNWTAQGNNINLEPDFIDPDNGDFRLRSTSSCKDAGYNSAPSIPSDDFEGDTRIIDTTVDIGADEVSVVTTCVNDETGLNNALTTAKSNGKGDVIMVQQGSYTGNFYCDSSEGYDITLLGGFTSGCASRMIDPKNTTLDGQNSNRALYITESAGGDITVDGFTIQNGFSAAQGGGAEVMSTANSGPAGDVTIINNIIKGNTSNWTGGGIIAYSYTTAGGAAGDIKVINNIATGNSADQLGGGIYAGSYTTSGGAAGTVTCTNNTVTGNNSDTSGGGVYLRATGTPDGIVYAYNNIIWGNTATSSGDDVYLSRGLGNAYGYNNNYSDLGGASWDSGESNIDSDPKLSSNFHLKPGSPCIDAGTNTAPSLPSTDMDGGIRIVDGNRDDTATVDMGAYEYIPKGLISHFLILLLN